MTQDIYELLPPKEADLNLVYGIPGSGKTSYGSLCIVNDLMAGHVVYANWDVRFNEIREWDFYTNRLLGLIGLKNEFWTFPRENFHFWNYLDKEMDGKKYGEDFITKLSSLNDCCVHLDEGHLPFDSYEATRMSPEKRAAIFATRHFNRSLSIYTQRPQSVHVNVRANCNRFYKCESEWVGLPGLKKQQFTVTEFLKVNDNNIPDEEMILDDKGLPTNEYKNAASVFRYEGNQNHFDLFDSKYMRKGVPHSQANYARREELSLKDVWRKTLKPSSIEL